MVTKIDNILLTDLTNEYEIKDPARVKDTNQLLTESKSIIKAINEIYINQQSLYNTLLLLFDKLKESLGDIIEDDILR